MDDDALFADSLPVAFAQLLHSMGFAVLHFAIVLTAQRQFPSEAAARVRRCSAVSAMG